VLGFLDDEKEFRAMFVAEALEKIADGASVPESVGASVSESIELTDKKVVASTNNKTGAFESAETTKIDDDCDDEDYDGWGLYYRDMAAYRASCPKLMHGLYYN